MPAGRPTEYSQDIILKAQEYILNCRDEDYSQKKSESVNSAVYENKIKVKLPSIEGIAVYLGIHKDTIYEWEKIYPEFSDIINKLRQIQAERLINNGLSGDYNPMITKLLLAKHGYRDTQELVGAGGKDLIPDPETKKAADEAIGAFLGKKKDDNPGDTQQQQSEID